MGVLGAALAATYDVNLAATARAADLRGGAGAPVGGPAGRIPPLGGCVHQRRHDVEHDRARGRPRARAAGIAPDGFDGTPRRRCTAPTRPTTRWSGRRGRRDRPAGPQAADRRAPPDPRRRRGRAIAADRDAGIMPVAVVANGGTTLTGAVDPLDGLADVCARHGVWLHVAAPTACPPRAPRGRDCSPGSSGSTRSRSTPTSGWASRRAAAWCWCASPGAGAAFGHEESYIRRDRRREPGRAHAGVLAADQLPEALAGAAHPRRGRIPWLDRAAPWLWRPSCRGWSRDDRHSSCSASRSCPRSASATSPGGSTTPTPTTLRWPTRGAGRAVSSWPTPWWTATVCLRVCFVNFRTRPEDVDFALDTLRALGRGLTRASDAAASA